MQSFESNQKGVALLLVLWVLTLLTVIVGEFSHAMRTETNIIRNFKEATQAFYIAEAGLNRAIHTLIMSQSVADSSFAFDLIEENEDPLFGRVNIEIPPTTFTNGKYRASVINESGKVDINTADAPLLRILLNQFDLADDQKAVIIDSILDWRDEDDYHRLNGAENDFYESLAEPYPCKNGPFDAAEELLLVRGVTPEVFHGGLKEMVTVYGSGTAANAKIRRRVRTRGKVNTFNINAAPPPLLRSFPQMSDDLVEELVAYRKENEFKSLTEVLDLIGPDAYASMAPFLSLVKSPYNTIRAEGTIGGSKIKQQIEALVIVDARLPNRYQVLRRIDR